MRTEPIKVRKLPEEDSGLWPGLRRRLWKVVSGPAGYIEGSFVLPEDRSKGIGSALVRSAEQWAKDNGFREMASDTEIGNELGLAAHLGLCYEVTSKPVHLRKEIG